MIQSLVSSGWLHLAQSTVFAGLAALLTPAFRANKAQVRYWLWLSASVKFLLPFALLVTMGTHLGTWAPHSVMRIGTASPALSSALENVGRLSHDALPALATSASTHPMDRRVVGDAMVGVWLCGFVCVGLIRVRGWRRIRRLIRANVCTNIAARVEVRTSAGVLEPGVVGWIRPILLLPAGMAERLEPSEMNAILAHELCHVRRRDNLLASVHMMVEAIFWFHPLVWWIGARLMEERERACDEEVVSAGNAPDIYADAILKVCRWSAQSPLACVAGVTGGNLKTRVEHIMNGREAPRLSAAKKAGLAFAGAAVLLTPVVAGFTNAPEVLAQSPAGAPEWQAAAGDHMAFEVASVREVQPGSRPPMPNFPLDTGDAFQNPRSGESPHGRFNAAFPLSVYITFAYKLWLTPDEAQVMLAHTPKWVETDLYEIVAKAPGNPTKDQMRLMMQSLLAERFHLAAHLETHEVSAYALTPIKPGTMGPKLIRHADGPPCDQPAPASAGRSTAGDPDAEVFPRMCDVQALIMKNGRMVLGSRNTTMDLLAASLSGRLGRPVVDRSGFTGRVDYRLEWAPEPNSPGAPGGDVPPDPQGVSFIDAVHEQLGLKVESTKAAVQTLVIDHVERPTEN